MPTLESQRPDASHTAASVRSSHSSSRPLILGKWRHVAGLSFLSVTIFLWTASNFLASTIFADSTYSKPYFVAYVNTSFFMIPLLPMIVRTAYFRPRELKSWSRRWRADLREQYAPLKQADESTIPHAETSAGRGRVSPLRSPSQELLLGEPLDQSQVFSARSIRTLRSAEPPLTVRETARLSLEFCVLWFIANYFAGACLQYTSVASATILNSTCSVFTLILGAVFHVERFTLRKMLGVLASLAGIIAISLVDLSGQNSDDQHRGDFPAKSAREIAIGDIMALLAAFLYGAYSVLMKKRIADESRVNMQLFFGLVGLFNVLLLWPGFLILHFTGVEQFQLPPTSRITMIVLMNAAVSLISDISWVYAVLFTSPLVVTVGLSITIPLSLIGQILLNNQTVGLWYWVGAISVFVSFILVDQEAKTQASPDTEEIIADEP